MLVLLVLLALLPLVLLDTSMPLITVLVTPVQITVPLAHKELLPPNVEPVTLVTLLTITIVPLVPITVPLVLMQPLVPPVLPDIELILHPLLLHVVNVLPTVTLVLSMLNVIPMVVLLVILSWMPPKLVKPPLFVKPTNMPFLTSVLIVDPDVMSVQLPPPVPLVPMVKDQMLLITDVLIVLPPQLVLKDVLLI